MNLTEQQKATLKTAIQGTPVLIQLYADGDLGGLANALNAEASPAFVVWRESYSAEQKAAAILAAITQLDGLAANKREVVLWWSSKTHDARDGFTEAAINDMCGSQNTLKAALLAGAKRNATVLEKVFSTGTGTKVSPATPAIVGAIGWTDLIGI